VRLSYANSLLQLEQAMGRIADYLRRR
jgi:hypothetical protein